MVAVLNQICSCHWQGVMRVQPGLDCPVHDDEALTAKRNQLIRDREAAAVATQIHRTETLTWLRRYRASRRRLKELTAQLREIDPCCL